MNIFKLPPSEEMYNALLGRDESYEGVFVVGVKTTGIFCRPTCSAKKPLQKNVIFFSNTGDALAAGYRACKRCRPLEVAGKMPADLQKLVERVEQDPSNRLKDGDLRAMGIDPIAARRWFQANHGITFHKYQRSRRLAAALHQIAVGEDLTNAGFDAGFESSSGFRNAFKQLFGTSPGNSTNGTKPLVVNRILTPLGPMVIAADDEQLFLLEFADRRMLQTQINRLEKRLKRGFIPGENRTIVAVSQQLKDYFDGTLQEFTIPIAMPGTEFQRKVWQRLLEIPFGETLSYDQLARSIGHVGAQRAVGRANGDNRLTILVPCHRVVRSDGTLCGYGGGMHRKRFLLDHEMSALK